MPRSPLVSPSWLANKLASPDVVVVNAWLPPVGQPDTQPEYGERHIPGAVFFDVNAISDPASDLPHMLPPAHIFSSMMRKLGIGDGQTIVVYDGVGLYSAARVWWMFRAMGVEDVHVLDGGLPGWEAAGHPVEDMAPAPRGDRHFSARLNHGLVADRAKVARMLEAGGQVLDARSRGRFAGTDPEPRAGLRGGHMPGALNLPFTELMSDGRLKDTDALTAAFDTAGVDRTKPVVTTCGSGVTAAILSLALTVAGQDKAPVYDGSWTEWGGREDTPVATGDS
ncbi:3-mercaptopyruvate sulfurtransferase [Stappia sp. ES.058]|uniref:3-mercaptopyruvate sulfurtransferase n=1 Tax=Stappia sp. ES.058 TaxID=1881061 RepID=UPI000879E19D|nr:3-mercaptopyruvate sulfurtransferase [Stappia sp. ES.058]SDU01351.1 thiosulfate/3-mercaptopyruvate sulfurtransferase [Stappia sp. ES.058]